MKSWKLGLQAAVLALAPAMVALAPVQAAAQSCKVTGEYGSTSNSFYIGSRANDVAVLGDLKIRTTFVETPTEWNPADGLVSDYIHVDIKAPGVDLRQVVLYRNSSQTFNICGTEVTLRFNGYYNTSVSLF